MKPLPHIRFGTPRKLPKASKLEGRVAVLDVAFASNAGGASFEKVTLPFINGLGDRLAMWIDHHDHERHVDYADDPRFVLRTKAQHGACPEMVTPERVARAGQADTVCCHVDFDGLCSAAKWILDGKEPYTGADADAYAIDTRIGEASPRGQLMDRALRGRPRDDTLKTMMVRYLVGGAKDANMRDEFLRAEESLERLEIESRRLATLYDLRGEVAVCDARDRHGPYEKTMLLLIGQEFAKIAVVHDETTVSIAAPFDSGVNLLEILGLDGGMPTRVSVSAKKLPEVLEKLGVSD